MKLLINLSNHLGGGGLQVALSFLSECRQITNNEYHVFMSPNVARQVDRTSFGKNFSFRSLLEVEQGTISFGETNPAGCSVHSFRTILLAPEVQTFGRVCQRILDLSRIFFFQNDGFLLENFLSPPKKHQIIFF